MTADRPYTDDDLLRSLAAQMRANSERWFPATHSADQTMPLPVFYALGLAGEVGEVANDVKKLYRDGGDHGERIDHLAEELADCLTYLLLLADEFDLDLVAAYRAKAAVNEERWG